MKLNRKKIIASLLCLLLASSLLLASCKTDQGTSKDESQKPSETSTTSGSGTEEIKGWNGERWVSEKIDPNKYKGQNKKWRVLILGTSYGTYSSREFTFSESDVLQSDVINDAAGKKNEYIKEHYGVEIVPIMAENNDSEGIMTLIRNDLNANEGAYDAVMPYMTYISSVAAEGRLVDMASTSYAGSLDLTQIIDFSMPWWDQSSISELSIRDKVFFATGDITLLNKVCAMSVVFNKDLIEDENPYELVDKGEWTLEKMYEMGKAFTKDADGDGIMTHNDNWGMSASHGDIIGYYASTNNKMVSLDSNREPVLAINGTEQIGVATKILEKLIDRSWLIHAQELTTHGVQSSEIWNVSLSIFGDGRALFRTGAFSAVEKLKMNYSVNYGIVPMPKINAEQEKYYSYVSDNGTVSGVSILDTAPDVEFSAYMIEVNAVEGKNYLTPAYYERVLKKQAAQDEETARMLDIIFANTVYDIGRIYNFGDINGILNGLVRDSSTDITSALDAAKGAIDEAISKVVQKFDELG